MNALSDELIWFKVKAEERQLNLSTEPQATCSKYCEYLKLVASMPYAVQATTLWAIELAYNQGWQLPGTMPEPYAEFAHRWGNRDFTEYVQLLEQLANEVLSTADETIQAQAESAFLEIARLEQDFWSMAMANK